MRNEQLAMGNEQGLLNQIEGRLPFLWLACFMLPVLVLGQSSVRVDGDFAEWQSIPVALTDPSGDQGSSQIDFQQLWVFDDADFLFLNIEVGSEINLQNGNEIQLFLDTDNDPTTGTTISGIGAELLYTLGERSGMVYVENNNEMIYHNDIGLVSAPTVSSDRFEIVIRKSLTFFGQSLFQGDSIKIFFKDNESGGDRIPDASGGIGYQLMNGTPEPLPAYTLTQSDSSHFRVLSYNVLSDGLFEPGQSAPMGRLLQAIQPDIIGFQEIYNRGALQVASEIEVLLPSGPSAQWYFAKEGPDIIAISKYPILDSYPIGNNGAFLLDLEAEFGQQMLLIVAHPPCCSNDQGRQEEFDEMMAFVRDAKAGTGALQLDPNTPILIVGDMNLVGLQRQLQTLLTGDILNNGANGPDFIPDWDSTALDDASPIVTGLPMTYTWFNENSSFSPGKLDYIIYSGSVMELVNQFTLFTRTLPQDTLTAYGLQQEDAILASDHLPLVSDFRLTNLPTTGIGNRISENPLVSLTVSPNPSSHSSTITYELQRSAMVSFSLLTPHGAQIQKLAAELQPAGKHRLIIENTGLSSGIYLVKLTVGEFEVLEKILIAR